MKKNFSVEIYPDESTGTYWGTIPEVQGCNTQGDSVEAVLENIKESLELSLRPIVVPGLIRRTITVDVANA